MRMPWLKKHETLAIRGTCDHNKLNKQKIPIFAVLYS